ncbi:SRPBCC family protein [Streptomyces virginiae]|uniref:hypothetical protein n=1 Tax=Streptomyces virginiae TaxID=1961 RepID=UPI000A845F93|nr:hypothetical protein [Streptomyces virginiae]
MPRPCCTLVGVVNDEMVPVRAAQDARYRFSGLPMRLVGLLMPGAFRRQSRQHMQDFKAFAEQGKDVREVQG